MDLGFSISTHVINTINALPQKERIDISAALTAEFLLGEDPREHLNAFENILYTVIRYYVERDRTLGTRD